MGQTGRRLPQPVPSPGAGTARMGRAQGVTNLVLLVMPTWNMVSAAVGDELVEKGTGTGQATVQRRTLGGLFITWYFWGEANSKAGNPGQGQRGKHPALRLSWGANIICVPP